ncbi:LysR family transcriptional regulator [Marinospirillum perlucidum]|uniref:LysR family transcriptional regulator n=1 Tax=Marinospirillum perlucidum TaxID=1982602 RepID=UPI001FEBC650|nr:LysR family transcriptional regulator [Marinospirillum perlucidum]
MNWDAHANLKSGAIKFPKIKNGVCKIEQKKRRPKTGPNRIHWDDFETLLAIADTGSLSGAARELGVSHATIFRRLGEMEKRLGVLLFERSRRGYAPTQAGEDLAATAREIQASVLAVERKVAGRDLQPRGPIWVTTTDSLLAGLLAPLFVDFRQEFPEISLDIAVSNQPFNLTRREADVAIRASNSPPDHLVGRKLVEIGMAVYGRKSDYPQAVANLDEEPWVGPGARLMDQPLIDWMTDQGYDDLCYFRVDTLIGMLSAVKAGMGIAVLPCYLADYETDLIQLTDPIESLSYPLWFLLHPDLRGVARINSLLEFMTEAVRLQKKRLAGQPRA